MAAEPGNTYNEFKNYCWVNLQMGVPFEADKFNIESQIHWNHLRRSICELIGNGSSNLGFYVDESINPADPTIKAGSIYVCGLKVELENDVLYSSQPWVGEAPAIATPSTGSFYLDLTVEKIGAVEDPEIIHPDINIECIKPMRIKWVVKWDSGTALPAVDTATGYHHFLCGYMPLVGYSDLRSWGTPDAGSETGYEDREGGRLGGGHFHFDDDIWCDSLCPGTGDYAAMWLPDVINALCARLFALEVGGPPPGPHALTHESGGVDPINLQNIDEFKFGFLMPDLVADALWFFDATDIGSQGIDFSAVDRGWDIDIPVSLVGVYPPEAMLNYQSLNNLMVMPSVLPAQMAHVFELRLRQLFPSVIPDTWAHILMGMGNTPSYYDLATSYTHPYYGWDWNTGSWIVLDPGWLASLRDYGITFDCRSPGRFSYHGTNILLEGLHAPIGWTPGPLDPNVYRFSHFHVWRGPLSITTNDQMPGTANPDLGAGEPWIWDREIMFEGSLDFWLNHLPLQQIILGTSPNTARTVGAVTGNPVRGVGDFREDGLVGVFEWNLLNQCLARDEADWEYLSGTGWHSVFGNPLALGDENKWFCAVGPGADGVRDLDLNDDGVLDDVDLALMVAEITEGHDAIRGYPNIVCPRYDATATAANEMHVEEATDVKTRGDHSLNMAYIELDVTITGHHLTHLTLDNPVVVQFKPASLYNQFITGILGVTCEILDPVSGFSYGPHPVRVENSLEIHIVRGYTSALTGFEMGKHPLPGLGYVFRLRAMGLKASFPLL